MLPSVLFKQSGYSSPCRGSTTGQIKMVNIGPVKLILGVFKLYLILADNKITFDPVTLANC